MLFSIGYQSGLGNQPCKSAIKNTDDLGRLIGWSVEIKTLKQLLGLIEEIKCKVIICNSIPTNKTSEGGFVDILIYDYYIE
jgi:hypothetical protein